MELQLLDINKDKTAPVIGDKILDNEKIKEIKSSLVKIEIGNEIKIGFFYLIKNEDNSEIPVLVTNNHVIDLDCLATGKKIKIYINDSKEKQEIEIKENTRRFTNKCLDVTMIEVEKNDLIKFLEFENEEIKEDKKIYILHQQKDKEPSFSDGIIKSIDNFNIKYSCNTKSFEGVILDKNSCQVLGIPKLNNSNLNNGTLIKYANDRFIKTIKNEIIYDFMDNKDKYSNSIFYKKIEIDGDEYEGEITEKNVREGYGWCKSADNYIYKGEYKNNKRNGYGILLKIKNEKEIKEYEGYWKDDKMHGKGEQNLHDGTFYIGEWNNGKRQIGEVIATYDESFKERNIINLKYIAIFKIILGVIIFILVIYLNDLNVFYRTYTWDNGDKYDGKWKNGKFEGHGVYTWAQGDKYDGEWKNGQKEGHGIIIYSNGDKFLGEWKNNKKEGNGIIIYSNGDKYEGYWKNDKKEGNGIFTYINGDKYNVEWKNNKNVGNGVYIYSNGDKYEGHWVNNKKEGLGKLTYFNGDKYSGQWKNDKKEGRGILYYFNGDKYEGRWKNDKKEENGEYTYLNGDKYTGKWKNGKKEGRGKFIYINGDKYEGGWKNDKKEGRGIFYYSNGDKYEGYWKNDKKEGIGMFIYSNGDKYYGGWKNDKKEGRGTLTYSNGDKYDGEWKNDQKVSPP